MAITFIPKTQEILELNKQAEKEFESGLELNLENLLDKEDLNLYYDFYCNVNLVKKIIWKDLKN